MGLPAREWARGDRYPHIWIPSRRLWTPRVIPGIRNAITLVGSVGAGAIASSTNMALTPAWGTGESRTVGNILILWYGGFLTGNFPTTPSGWTIGARQAGSTNVSAGFFWKAATGGDAAPTLAALTGTAWAAQLAEFSGVDTTSPLDRNGFSAGTLSPQVAAGASADTAPNELILGMAAALYSAAATKTLTQTLNNGATANDTDNDASTLTWHYSFTWGVTTSNAALSQSSLAVTVTKITQVVLVMESLKLAAAVGGPQPPLMVLRQAVGRSSSW